MPPKKHKMKDIRSFYKTIDKSDSGSSAATDSAQPGGATGSQPFTRSQVKKEENDGDSTGGHLHRFNMKFNWTDRNKYTIDCDEPRTVLEAIKSSEHFIKKMKNKKCSDENIVIQLGKKDKKSIVARHFPCSCISNGETLIVSCQSETVEEAKDQHYKTIHPRDKYSVFYIDTVGGLHTKSKLLFRSKAVKQFKYLCVYGEKGTTVEEALKRDGRFIDDLGDFTLSDNDNPNTITERTQKVDNLDGKEFKICLPLNKRAKDETQQESSGASNPSKHKTDRKVVADVVKQSGISVQAAMDNGVNTEEIYERLRDQFPDLKEWMEGRFPGGSYQEALNLRKENFGKSEQSFSDVHRVRKLLKLGESVCKVVVENVCQGTGFVLFDNFILTNAHLFKGCVEGQNVFVLFNYEAPEPHIDFYHFQAARIYTCCTENDLDYAILELNPEGQKSNQTKKMKVPPGLLKMFGPLPPEGEACIIGHPAGGVKKMDPTFIIEKEKREQAVNDHLGPYKDSLFIVQSIIHLIKGQGIENIMMGGSRAEKVATMNTFMYHGSSGSPVFDAHCRVFGLHTGGYVYGFKNHEKGVIEFAQPLLTIFEHFVSEMKKKGDMELLKRVEEEAKGNPHLQKVLGKTTDTEEPRDTEEEMEIN